MRDMNCLTSVLARCSGCPVENKLGRHHEASKERIALNHARAMMASTRVDGGKSGDKYTDYEYILKSSQQNS